MGRIRRTSVSRLSDDELIVIDPMFNALVAVAALAANNYRDAFNTDYTHALVNHDQLADCLDRLVRDGLVFTKSSLGTTFYGLTSRGGALWEDERLPKWDRYCSSGESEDQGLWRLEVVVSSPEVGQAFLRTSKEFGVYPDIDVSAIAWQPYSDAGLKWNNTRDFRVAEIPLMSSGNFSTMTATDLRRQVGAWSTVGDLNALFVSP